MGEFLAELKLWNLKQLEPAPAEFGNKGGIERAGVPSRKKGRGPKRSNAGQAGSVAQVSCRNLQKIFTSAAYFQNCLLG